MDFQRLARVLTWLTTRPANKGDAAVLKAEALGARPPPHVEALLKDVRGYVPPIDLTALRALPDGTFGREYARHMDTNALEPYVISDAVDFALVEKHTFIVRQTVTHDMLHLLLGFDVSEAGELGVFAFTVAQGYNRAMWVGLQLVRVVYPLRHPLQARAILRAIHRGLELGRQARPLLAVRLEEHWAQPLRELRVELGIPADGHEGVGKPGGAARLEPAR